jgi:hypothetical protein
MDKIKVLKFFIYFILIALIVIGAFFGYMGAFSNIMVSEQKIGPYTVVYEPFIGPYSQAGKVYDKLSGALSLENVKTSLGIGIYYDDHGKVLQNQLRSDCGIVLQDKDLTRVRVDELSKKKYLIKTIAKSDSVVVEFLVKNKFSYMLGPIKAYPALMKYVQQKGYKMALCYELYDMLNQKVSYVLTITK